MKWSNKWLVWIIAAIALLVGVAYAPSLWYTYQQRTYQPQEDEDLSQNRTFVGGTITSVNVANATLKVFSGTTTYTVIFDKNTKIFRQSREDTPRDILMTAAELKYAQSVSIETGESIGDKTTLYAQSIFVLL